MTGLLYLLALIPLVLSQVEPTRDPPVDDELPVEPTRGGPGPDDGGDCVDEYSNCGIIAVNNWCDEEHYKGKCCSSCKKYEEEKDPECHDVQKGCVYYKKDMCSKDGGYADECKKTCGGC